MVKTFGNLVKINLKNAKNMILLPYPPSVNRMWRNFNGRMVLSPEGRKYKIAAAMTCMANGMRPIAGDVEVNLILHPKLTTKGAASRIRLDLDNMCKCVLDSLNGVGYTDDYQIIRLVAELGEPIQNGGVSVKVSTLSQKYGELADIADHE